MIISLNDLFRILVKYIENIVSALGKFFRSSYLSLIFLGIILIATQGLEQVNTLLIDMIEVNDYSLYLTFYIVAAFSSVLAHYPRYIYYAKNINDSKDDHYWYINKVWFYPIFTFSKINQKRKNTEVMVESAYYKQDYKAKFFRYLLGLVVFIIWHYYIYEAFYTKLILNCDIENVRYIVIVLCAIPPLILVYLLHKLDVYQNRYPDYHDEVEANNSKENPKEVFRRLGAMVLIICAVLVIVNVVIMMACLEFNLVGFWLLQSLTFLLAMQYIFFRVFRVHLKLVNTSLNFFTNNFNYLSYYFLAFIGLIILLVYCNYAAMNNGKLPNGLVVLLSYVFIFYYLIVCIFKYSFVLGIIKFQLNLLIKKDKISLNNKTDKELLEFYGSIDNYNQEELKKYWAFGKNSILNKHYAEKIVNQYSFSRNRFKWSAIINFAFALLFIASFFNEEGIHQLELFENKPNQNEAISLQEFKHTLKTTKLNKPLFFVSAEGGGLKANIWTMKLLSEIQKQTDGVFLDQTVSLSGASGGMMGLSLYSVLEGRFANGYDSDITKKYDELGTVINKIGDQDFASPDMALTLGADFVRKLIGLSNIGKYRDRSYYAMRRYQNFTTDSLSDFLNQLPFKTYWKKNVYNEKKYFPALIVNTSKTNGKRGVFFSLDYPDNKMIFNNAERLSSIPNKSVAFYEAVSTTNRFPFLSPAAKIKGYGHFIDGGAIDNSGLLSSLDLFQSFLKDKTLTDNDSVVFVQIINSKSNFVKKILSDYKKVDSTSLLIDEKELDNLVADLKTGLNLDKMPNYLSDFLSNYKSIRPNFSFIQFYLPYHVSIKDIEEILGGELSADDRKLIEGFLVNVNRLTAKALKDGKYKWDTYEPTLARHLSESTIKYYDRILNHENIQNKIEQIKGLTCD